MTNPFLEIDKRLSNIECLLLDLKHPTPKPQPETKQQDPLDDLIPKSEVRGKIASASTLWKYEKEGKIKSYAIGGKRFYKRSELMEAFTELKQ